MILLAQVGCGTQAQRQVNTGLVARPDLQFVAVVDPNTDSQDYVDWGPCGQPRRHPHVPRRPDLGRGDTGIRAGREVATADHGDLLREAGPPEPRHPILRGLPRDAREGDRHPGHRQHHARPPARQHQHRGAEEGQGGRSRTSRSRACCTRCAARSRPRARARRRRTCSPTATTATGTRSPRGSQPA